MDHPAHLQDGREVTVTAASKALKVGERGIYHARVVLSQGTPDAQGHGDHARPSPPRPFPARPPPAPSRPARALGGGASLGPGFVQALEVEQGVRRGELARLVHDIEREATKPLHRDDIAAEVLTRKGWAHNPDLLETVADKVKDVRKQVVS